MLWGIDVTSLFFRSLRQRSTLLMLSAVMLLLQLLLVGLIALHAVSSLFTAKSGVHLEVVNGASDEQIQELYDALRDLPYVTHVEYVPKEQAYEREKLGSPELVQSLEQFGVENPFPDTFSVVLASLDSFDTFSSFVSQAQWKGVIDPSFLTSVTSQQNDVQSYLSVSESLTSLGFTVLWIGIIAVMLIVIDLASHLAGDRREEIGIQRAMGAAPVQAVTPIAAELSMLLVVALAIGCILALFVVLLLPVLVPGFAMDGTFAEARAYIMPAIALWFPLVVLLQVIALPLLSVVSTAHVAGFIRWPGFRS